MRLMADEGEQPSGRQASARQRVWHKLPPFVSVPIRRAGWSKGAQRIPMAQIQGNGNMRMKTFYFFNVCLRSRAPFPVYWIPGCGLHTLITQPLQDLLTFAHKKTPSWVEEGNICCLNMKFLLKRDVMSIYVQPTWCHGSDLPVSVLWKCSSSFCWALAARSLCFCRNLSNKSASWTVYLLERPLGGGQLFYAAHRHNVVLPTASLGASGTVRNEATSDAKPFHEKSPFQIRAHKSAGTHIWIVLPPFSGGQTQSNRRMLSHQTSSTRWTPPTWCWLLSTAIGTFAVNDFCILAPQSGLNRSSWTLLLPSINLFFSFTAPAWPSSLCTTASGPTRSPWTPWTRYQFPSLALIYSSLPSTPLPVPDSESPTEGRTDCTNRLLSCFVWKEGKRLCESAKRNSFLWCIYR